MKRKQNDTKSLRKDFYATLHLILKATFLFVYFNVGYGHIAPKTPVGKIVTIFYAILGIPITVICWSNIGDAMAKAFRYVR